MKPFMDENFLLNNGTAEQLYHNFAKSMPIFDYHCHLNAKEIAENKKYRNITEVWLREDHYKWRALRSNGVAEKYVTGNASDKDKFMKWAETMPNCIGNPLYHWAHLELKRYFCIDKTLSPETAEEIWTKCNEMLQKEEFTARGLIKRSNVKALCTTDDPVDSLEYHLAIAKDKTFDVKVLPAFRPDKGINIDRPEFAQWVAKLEKVSKIKINNFNNLKDALRQRVEFFHEAGCRISDHGLEPAVYENGTEDEAAAVLQKVLKGENVSSVEINKYKTQVMTFLGREYSKRGWVMQLHIGATRNNSSRMFKLVGPDTGFDAIGDSVFAEPLTKLLDNLDSTNELPKTVLYCLNPRDNEMVCSLMGCFQGGGTPGKMQFGSGWWYNDQKDGMEKQMIALANIGLLSRFVGMLTDSRSFLSYTRHEYFRRIFCNLLGEWVEAGEVPNDMKLLKSMVENICFNNAKDYFGIDL